MATTFKPVFEALNFKDERRQLDLVKLLHVTGAFGEIKGAPPMLSDEQARDVLERITFDSPEHALRMLHEITQGAWLRKPQGAERHEAEEPDRFKTYRGEIAGLLKSLGRTQDIVPQGRRFQTALVLGAMESTVDQRLATLKEAWDRGVRFDKIYLLGSARPLIAECEPSAALLAQEGKPLTEAAMMERRFAEISKAWPAALRAVVATSIDTLMKPGGTRPNTQDTVASWLAWDHQPCKVIAFSNQPHAAYQEAAIRSLLPPGSTLEMAAAKVLPEHVQAHVALDSMAREIDVGMGHWLERLHAAPHQAAQSQMLFVMLDPQAIRVDPATYQFRRHGQEGNGVTEAGKLQSRQWIPVLHGDPLIVHQRRDGTLYVADGHHRLDLARALNKEGKGPGQVAALVLREEEGYTAKDVRLIAARRNMAQGHVDVFDAARVFKEEREPGVHSELLPSLQMDKGNLKIAYSMSFLSGKALDFVEREDIPLEIAAELATRVKDPARQERVLEMIGRQIKEREAAPMLCDCAEQPGTWQTVAKLEPVARVEERVLELPGGAKFTSRATVMREPEPVSPANPFANHTVSFVQRLQQQRAQAERILTP